MHSICEENEDKKLKHGDVQSAIDLMTPFVFSYRTAYNWIDVLKRKNNINSVNEITLSILEKGVETFTELLENNCYRLILKPNDERMLGVNKYLIFSTIFKFKNLKKILRFF